MTDADNTEETSRDIDYWNVKVYDSEDGHERETLRGLTYGRADALMRIFDREGIQAQATPHTEDGKFVHGESHSVNWNHGATSAIPEGDERITSGDTVHVEAEVIRRTNTGVLHTKTERDERIAVSSENAEKVEETDDE